MRPWCGLQQVSQATPHPQLHSVMLLTVYSQMVGKRKSTQTLLSGPHYEQHHYLSVPCSRTKHALYSHRVELWLGTEACSRLSSELLVLASGLLYHHPTSAPAEHQVRQRLLVDVLSTALLFPRLLVCWCSIATGRAQGFGVPAIFGLLGQGLSDPSCSACVTIAAIRWPC